MKRNKDIQKELEELVPNFSKVEKDNPFQVPHNYFKDMQAEVFEKLENTKEKKAPNAWDNLISQVRWLLSPRPAFALAGVALIVAVFFFWNQPSQQVDHLVSLDVDLIEDYIENNIEDFDSDLFLDLALEEGIDFSSSRDNEEELLDEILDDLNDDELLNLL